MGRGGMGWPWLLLLTWDRLSLPLQGTLLYLLYLLSPPPLPRLEFWADFKFLEKTKIKPRNLNPLGTTANFFILCYYFYLFCCFGGFFGFFNLKDLKKKRNIQEKTV